MIFQITPHILHAGRYWQVKREGNLDPARIFIDKSEAVKWAKSLASEEKALVTVFDVTGRVEKQWSPDLNETIIT